MISCPSCSHPNADGSRFCSACASPLDLTSAPTQVLESSPASATVSQAHEGRFPPGILITGRYRVMGLLGRGGMGEVYRATDLALGQQVALKFLPEAAARDDRALARFHSEVRIARQVSHPNVCRVYDIGQVDGQPFISMEYVDGEDLGSLLRRIGRLPADKAGEIARKLCAGLAAAHDKGVLHRDLKPANVMLDGRGEVLITDFGLAAAAGEIAAADIRSGTPAYMAPEQLEGKDVTARSDIYALGLVLYEIYTGRHLELADRTAPPSFASREIDPAVERIIHRCVSPDPRNRPPSALAVAAALPGGDPLAAALAAGETPSPELVAAAGEGEGMSVRAAWLAAGGILLGLVAAMILGSQVNILQRIPFELPPEALVEKAREITRRFGFTAKPRDSAWGFDAPDEYFDYVRRQEPAAARFLRPPEFPPLVQFWYRQSPRLLIPQARSSIDPTPTDPPVAISGMVNVEMDPQGRLLSFQSVPPQVEDPAPPAPFDWSLLFAAAGLDHGRFQPVEPKWTPLANWDTRAAWSGPAGPYTVRVEAAAWRGKPVSFGIVGPWTVPGRMEEPRQKSATQQTGNILVQALVYLALSIACILAVRNARSGRGDARGAWRLALAFFAARLTMVALFTNHVAGPAEIAQFWFGVSQAAVNPLIAWILYMALEPYLRRRWPHTMIGWSRALSGRMRDPVVGRDLLVGIGAGILLTLIGHGEGLVIAHAGGMPSFKGLGWLHGFRDAAGIALYTLEGAASSTMILWFLLLLALALVRRGWLAAAAIGLLLGTVESLGDPNPALAAPWELATWLVVMSLLARYGGLALVAAAFVNNLLLRFRVNTDFSAWYAGLSLCAPALTAALALFAFRAATKGRKLLSGEWLS